MTTAQDLIVKIGTDMTVFPTAGHLCSWACAAPRVKESGGKRKGGAASHHCDVGMAYLACPRAGAEMSARRESLAWWALAVAVRSGYTPLAFGGRRLWAATADAAVLLAVMTRYSLLARRVDWAAALLAVPEVAWTAYATVLSTAVAAKTAGRRHRQGGPRDERFRFGRDEVDCSSPIAAAARFRSQSVLRW